MTPTSVAAWLALLEQRHPQAIDLGLARVGTVADRLSLRRTDCPVVTVAGTNGKGSTVAMLTALGEAAGLRVASYTSPHLLRFHERMACAGRLIRDDELLTALATVEAARGDISLTYFEHTTLAAWCWFRTQSPDLMVLEIGLGGRLDAVNLVDPDVAVITSVGLDHQDWLGETVAEIAREKAGIVRAGRPVVLGEAEPDPALLDAVAGYGAAPVCQRGRDFHWQAEGRVWTGGGQRLAALPPAAILDDNLATALAAWQLLCARRPAWWSGDAIRAAVARAFVPGRCQRLPGRPDTWLDVGHNPHGVTRLWQQLGAWPAGSTVAVLGMLQDKDIAGVIACSLPHVQHWHVASLPPPRGADAQTLAAELRAAGVADDRITVHDTVTAAYRATRQLDASQRVVVFGSFLTVAAVLSAMNTGESIDG